MEETMDKYEFNIKVEQIKKLVNKKDFATAMKISDTIDWRRVRNANLLSMVSQVYEENGEYQEAKEVLLLAYERAPIGKRLLYKLGELAIREGSIKEAEDYYNEFCQLAPNDPRRFLLQYLILKEKGMPVSVLIQTIEQYTATEPDEKWLYELAQLYAEAGRSSDCVQTCDKITLMFGMGNYGELAKELKQRYMFASKNNYQNPPNNSRFGGKIIGFGRNRQNIRGNYESESVYGAESDYSYRNQPSYDMQSGYRDEAVYGSSSYEDNAAYGNEVGYGNRAAYGANYENNAAYGDEADYRDETAYGMQVDYENEAAYGLDYGDNSAYGVPNSYGNTEAYGTQPDQDAFYGSEIGYEPTGAYDGGAYSSESVYGNNGMYDSEEGYSGEATYGSDADYQNNQGYEQEPDYNLGAGYMSGNQRPFYTNGQYMQRNRSYTRQENIYQQENNRYPTENLYQQEGDNYLVAEDGYAQEEQYMDQNQEYRVPDSRYTPDGTYSSSAYIYGQKNSSYSPEIPYEQGNSGYIPAGRVYNMQEGDRYIPSEDGYMQENNGYVSPQDYIQEDDNYIPAEDNYDDRNQTYPPYENAYNRENRPYMPQNNHYMEENTAYGSAEDASYNQDNKEFYNSANSRNYIPENENYFSQNQGYMGEELSYDRADNSYVHDDERYINREDYRVNDYQSIPSMQKKPRTWNEAPATADVQGVDEELMANIHQAAAEKELAAEMSRISTADYIEPEAASDRTRIFRDRPYLKPLDSEEKVYYERSYTPHHLLIEAKTPERGFETALEALKQIHEETGLNNQVIKISGSRLSKRGVFNVSDKLAGKDLVVEEAGDLTQEDLEELQMLMERDETGMVVVLIDNPFQMEELHQQNPGFINLFKCMREGNRKISVVENMAQPQIEPKDVYRQTESITGGQNQNFQQMNPSEHLTEPGEAFDNQFQTDTSREYFQQGQYIAEQETSQGQEPLSRLQPSEEGDNLRYTEKKKEFIQEESKLVEAEEKLESISDKIEYKEQSKPILLKSEEMVETESAQTEEKVEPKAIQTGKQPNPVLVKAETVESESSQEKESSKPALAKPEEQLESELPQPQEEIRVESEKKAEQPSLILSHSEELETSEPEQIVESSQIDIVSIQTKKDSVKEFQPNLVQETAEKGSPQEKQIASIPVGQEVSRHNNKNIGIDDTKAKEYSQEEYTDRYYDDKRHVEEAYNSGQYEDEEYQQEPDRPNQYQADMYQEDTSRLNGYSPIVNSEKDDYYQSNQYKANRYPKDNYRPDYENNEYYESKYETESYRADEYQETAHEVEHFKNNKNVNNQHGMRQYPTEEYEEDEDNLLYDEEYEDEEQEEYEELVSEDDEEEMDLDTFAEYAISYATEIDCSITGKSKLALYERIELMEEDGIPLTKATAEDLIEEAADKAEKPSFSGLIKGVFSSKYDKEGLLILKEEHFI